MNTRKLSQDKLLILAEFHKDLNKGHYLRGLMALHQLPSGTVYRFLCELDREGWLRSEFEAKAKGFYKRKRKFYHLTQKGYEHSRVLLQGLKHFDTTQKEDQPRIFETVKAPVRILPKGEAEQPSLFQSN